MTPCLVPQNPVHSSSTRVWQSGTQWLSFGEIRETGSEEGRPDDQRPPVYNILRPWAAQGTLRYALTPQLSLLPSSFSVYFLLPPDVSLACCALSQCGAFPSSWNAFPTQPRPLPLLGNSCPLHMGYAFLCLSEQTWLPRGGGGLGVWG